MLRLLIVLVAAVAGLLGCASPSPPPTLLPSESGSVIYIYRPNFRMAVGSLSCPSHNVDGGAFSDLPHQGSISFKVPSGPHTIGTRTSLCFVPPLELQVYTREGETTFVRFSYSDTPRTGFISTGRRLWVGLEAVSREQALREISP